MQIKHYKDDYYISDTGEVFKKLHPYKSHNGYLTFKDKYGTHNLVHRMVAEKFLPNEKSMILDVNHKDGNRENNNVDNLEWCTRSENLKHSFEQLGQTPVRFFKKCELWHNGVLIDTFETCREASKYAEKYGAKYSMLERHRKHNGWEIRCIDYSEGK